MGQYLQSYDVDIRHIPGKKNPSDALTRKGWLADRKYNKDICNEDSELVQLLTITPDASNKDVQEVLTRLFTKD